MTEHYNIVLDVGQTFVRCALVDQEGNILPDSFSIFSSKLDQSKEEILSNLVKIIKFNINSILHPNFLIQNIGFSLPDSMFLDDDKRSIDEEKLNRLLHKDPTINAKISETCRLYIDKESQLFAIGEHILRKEKDKDQDVLYVIIGTELSVTLMNNGLINPNVSNQTVKDISSKKIMNISRKEGLKKENLTAKEIAELALKGNIQAINTYKKFGVALGEALTPILEEHPLGEIFIGGNITLSYPLFQKQLEKTIHQYKISVRPTNHTFYYVLFGLSAQIKKIS